MKVAAVIAEYNPFHNGHAYQLEETRKITGADYILVLMSGNYVQRGTPAVFNKYFRAQAALLGGADIVLELPLLYACSSAEFFAGGGITLLNRLNSIDNLSFGSECGDIQSLLSAAHFLTDESSGYQEALRALLKQGLSFPAAREQAIMQTFPCSDKDTVSAVLSSPNNILGMEYCKSLLASNSSICPVTIKRTGDYHDDSLQKYSSASALRKALLQTDASLKEHMPSQVFALLSAQKDTDKLTCLAADDFSQILYYKLLSEKQVGFTQYLDCSQDISDKICRMLPQYTSFTAFCDLLKSKNITYTRISRILLHILLDIHTPASYHTPFASRELFIPYARLLGFKKEASPLLNHLKKKSSVPIISTFSEAVKTLCEPACSMLQKDAFACDIYEEIYHAKSKQPAIREYCRTPVIL